MARTASSPHYDRIADFMEQSLDQSRRRAVIKLSILRVEEALPDWKSGAPMFGKTFSKAQMNRRG